MDLRSSSEDEIEVEQLEAVEVLVAKSPVPTWKFQIRKLHSTLAVQLGTGGEDDLRPTGAIAKGPLATV